LIAAWDEPCAPDAKSRRRAIATPNINVGHGNRSFRRLAVSHPGTTLRRLSRRMWGARESANQEHGAWFLGSWAPGRERTVPSPLSVPLLPPAPSPFAPQNQVEGAKDDGAEGRGVRRQRIETEVAGAWRLFRPHWRSSPSLDGYNSINREACGGRAGPRAVTAALVPQSSARSRILNPSPSAG